MRALLWLFVVFLVNLPYVHESWMDRKIANDGHDVVAVVIDARELNDHFLIDYRLPKTEDPAGTKYSASIDAATYEQAVRSDAIGVRVLAGDPGANRPDGLVASSLFKAVAIGGNAVLLLIAVLVLYRRRNPGDMPDPNPRPVGL